ncbi:MAG TPA: hypothetical protein VKZ53_31165 [Candidatus Angelobacter sp.]|nr:hypothetical protein [Candidatus Angelobacter sp.]
MKQTHAPLSIGHLNLPIYILVLLNLCLPGRSVAQTATSLYQNVVSGISCAPSQNGTGHLVCGAERQIPGGAATLFSGASYQARPTTAIPPEPVATVHTLDVQMASGPITSTPGCAFTGDGSGAIVCAVEGPNNGLYGVSIHPQPTQKALPLLPLLLPGAIIPFSHGFGSGIFGDAPCNPGGPCNVNNIFIGLAAAPSCAAAGQGETVICGVVAVMQNTKGAAVTGFIGVSFDPNVGATSVIVKNYPFMPTAQTNPTCTNDTDHNTTTNTNGGVTFAVCALVPVNNTPWSSANVGLVAFDPRSTYQRGSLNIFSSTSFASDPSCATPRDGTTEIICAIVVGSGVGNTIVGLGFDPVARTTVSQNLGPAPSGTEAWTSVACASPNSAQGSQGTIACAATTSLDQVHALTFDPRVSSLTVNTGNFFSPPSGAAIAGVPSCISLNIVSNQITCAIVDSTGQAWAFPVPL